MERAGYRTRLRPTSLNSRSGSQRQRGLRWHARTPRVEAPVATTVKEMGGGVQALLRVGLEFPPRANGGRRVAELLDRGTRLRFPPRGPRPPG